MTDVERGAQVMEFRDEYEQDFWCAVFLKDLGVNGNPIQSADVAVLELRSRSGRIAGSPLPSDAPHGERSAPS